MSTVSLVKVVLMMESITDINISILSGNLQTGFTNCFRDQPLIKYLFAFMKRKESSHRNLPGLTSSASSFETRLSL